MLTACFQIFCLGFFLGFSGPCLFFCLPVIAAFSAGLKEDHKDKIFGLVVFLFGRLLAYILLGFLAGISGFILRSVVESRFNFYLNLLAGAISIGFGIYILLNKTSAQTCQNPARKILNFSSIFILGFSVGLSPCAPLMALLLEITLISKVVFQGAIYGAMFGLGTFISGFILALGCLGILGLASRKSANPGVLKIALRLASALILIFFGISFIFNAGK